MADWIVYEEVVLVMQDFQAVGAHVEYAQMGTENLIGTEQVEIDIEVLHVGEAVGDRVGAGEGALVGDVVGWCDGAGVGDAVGNGVGVSVGVSVGLGVGVCVGARVGADVGVTGAGVGVI